MSETNVNEDTGETLIDAEFEPARSAPAQPKPRGPGWLSFFLLAFLGVAALGLHFYPKDTATPAPIQNQTDTDEALDALRTAMGSAGARQDALADTVAQLQSDVRTLAEMKAAISALEVELAATNAQIETITSAPAAAEAPPAANQDAASSLDLAPLTRRLTALETQLAQFSDPAPVTEGEASVMTDLETRISALTDAQAVLEDRLFALEETLAGVPNLQAESRLKDAALAFAAIEDAARRGAAFITAYARLSDALPDNADVRALRPYASTPPPSWRNLRADFTTLAETAQALQTDSTTPSWFQNLVGDGIRVRRTDTQSATAQFSAAEQALNSETPADAIALIEALDADIQAPFTVWLQQAEARQNLDEALNRLRQTLLFEDRQ